MKEKSDIGPVSFIGEEKNNVLGLNIIYVGFVVIIQLIFPVGCFPAHCNGTFLQHVCVHDVCVMKQLGLFGCSKTSSKNW